MKIRLILELAEKLEVRLQGLNRKFSKGGQS